MGDNEVSTEDACDQGDRSENEEYGQKKPPRRWNEWDGDNKHGEGCCDVE